jgi:pimeloyl-ACP methyl ester carboxylesterase
MNRLNLDLLVIAAAFVLTSSGAPTATSNTLADLGGELCEDSAFTCLTLDLPVNHFDPSDDRTLAVTFAVLPASGARQGAFVVAVGGPGGSGLEEADWRFESFGPTIRERFDIVFFDQRGVDMGEELTCPNAAESSTDTWSQLPDDLPERWDPLVQATSAYVEDCVAEMPRGDLLPFLGTAQAAADLEAFRDAMDYDRLVLYGESYGTQFAQVYADAYPDSVERLILDGTIDLTLDAQQESELDLDAMDSVLGLVFEACDLDVDCAADMGMPAAEAYRKLETQLEEGPATVMLPNGDGGTEEVTLAAKDLGSVAFSNIYMESDRMVFLRALAAYAGRSDLVPLVRLNEVDGWSDISPAVYQSVTCLDTAMPGDTPEEETDNIRGAAEAAEPTQRGAHESALDCVFWPGVDHAQDPLDPFVGTGIPTLVIATEADPTTPYVSGLAVYEHLDDGYLIEVTGGSHVMFGRGMDCVDEAVTAYVIDGIGPDRITCDADLISEYFPLIPESLDGYSTAEILLLSEYELILTPEHLAWDELDDLTVGCNNGGIVTFTPNDTGTSYELEGCGLAETLRISGTGTWDVSESTSDLEISLGGDCAYKYHRDWDSGEESLTEDCS